MEQLRIKHYEDEDFRVEGVLFEGKYFLHITVERYSHNVQKRIDKLFEEMKTAAVSTGFVDEFYTATPNPRYARYLGGEHLDTVEVDGETMEVFRWELKS